MMRIFLTGIAFALSAAVAPLRAADTDACTYDFAAISAKRFAEDGKTNANAIPDPLGFKKDKVYVWHPDKQQDLPSENKLLDEAMVACADRDNGLFEMLAPDSLFDIVGGPEKAANLHNFASMKIPPIAAGKYKFSCNYRGNHKAGTADWSAYFIVSDSSGKVHFRINFPDTGDDSDYWNVRSREFEMPAGVGELTATLRFDGVGYFKVSKLSIVPVVDEKESEVVYKVPGSYDGKFAVNEGDVEALRILWRIGKGYTVPKWWRSGVEFVVPKGFSFVGFNGVVEKTEKRPDGTTFVRGKCLQLPEGIKVIPYSSFHDAFSLAVLLKADGTAGDTGTLEWQAYTESTTIGEKGSLELVTIPRMKVKKSPKHYMAGAMLTYSMQFFPDQPEANRAYAEHLRKCGVDWLMPELKWMRYDSTLLPMWREVGFKYITPVDNDYYSNGYAVPRTATRPPEDRFVKHPDMANHYDFKQASCPAAIYEERPFFLTNFVASIAKWAKGADGMWSNWETFYFRGCYCDGCKARLEEWKKKTGDSEEHFHSMQQGKICKTIQKHFKKIFGEDRPAFMPAICIVEAMEYASKYDYAPEKRSIDYAGDLNWLPVWGPYVAWEPDSTGPWRSNSGKTVAAYIAAMEARKEMDVRYGGKKPKLIFQPSGGNWMIQPEWLEVMMDAGFFNRIEACVPWVMPEGCDARLWKGFVNHVNRAARYEAAVWSGNSADAASEVVPKPGFEQKCPKPIAGYMPHAKEYFDYPTLQQKTYDYKGVRYVAVMNFNDAKHVEFTLKTKGLPPGRRYLVVREDGQKPYGKKTFSSDELAAGVGLSVPVSATRVFEIRASR